VGPLDAIWHLSNFFASAVGLGLFSAVMAKLAWRHDLKSVPLRRLCLWGVGAAAAASLGGLVAFGRDGKMATYALMVLACALGLWWSGFVSPRR